MSRVISAIYSRGPSDPMTEAEKDEAARNAWRAGSDMVAVRLSEIKNESAKEVILAELTKQHGARPKWRGGR